MADANDVFSELKRDPNVTYAALVPNQNGLERAFAKCRWGECFLSASESHNKSNINKSIKEALVVIEDITKQALFEGKK